MNGTIDFASLAGGLTRVVAHPSEDVNERVERPHFRNRFLRFSLGDQPNISLTVHVNWAGLAAWGDGKSEVVHDAAFDAKTAGEALIPVNPDVDI
jgi:hypothetical protein